MNQKLKTVIRFEVIRQLKKPSFWLALFLIPTFIFGISFLSATDQSQIQNSIENNFDQDKKIGLSDTAQFIDPEILKQNSNISLYPNLEQGVEAVKTGTIDAYYYLPPDFIDHPEIKLYTRRSNTNLFENYQPPIEKLLSATAVKNASKLHSIALTKKYTFNTTNFDQTGNPVNLISRSIIPGAILAIFYVLIIVFGNRMLMAVVEEKENRISEMLLTAISAHDLIVGKIFALIILGFIQISIFILPFASLLIINRHQPFINSILSGIEFNPLLVFANLCLLLFSYFLFAGFSVFVGSLTPTAKDASQYISIVTIGTIAPLFFINSFISLTPTPLTIFLSYFPLSAPIALMLRNTFGTLPWPEFLLGLFTIILSSIIITKLAVKSFHKNAINFNLVKPSFKPRVSWKPHQQK